VGQPLDVIAREQQLDGGEERTNEVVTLVADVLPDSAGGAHGRTLQLDDAKSDAIDVEDKVGTLGVDTPDRDFLDHHEVVIRRLRPVDQVDGLGCLPDVCLDLRTVPEQIVDLAVLVVERTASTECCRSQQLLYRTRDQDLVVVTTEQGCSQSGFVNVPVVPILQVAAVDVPELIPEELDDTALRLALSLPNCAHASSSTGKRVRPVSSSCIMP